MTDTRPDHGREHRSVLAAAEKRALQSLARRLPPWISADHLSAVGLASMAAAGAAFAMFSWAPWAAAGTVTVALAVNWFGDSLDGTVARIRGQERPRYGYYVDHVVDLAGTTFLFAGLALSGLMNPVAAPALLVAYLLVSAEAYLATHAAGVFRLSFAGIGPTELRLLLIAGTLKAAARPWVDIGGASFRFFDLGAAVGIAGLSIAFVTAAARNTIALYRAEPLPRGVGRPTRAA